MIGRFTFSLITDMCRRRIAVRACKLSSAQQPRCLETWEKHEKAGSAVRVF